MEKRILKKKWLLLVMLITTQFFYSQTGPAGIALTDGTQMYSWYKPNYLTAGALSSWSDLSGNSYHMVQTATDRQPTVVANTMNGYPVVRFDGTETAGLGDFIFAPVTGMTAITDYEIVSVWKTTSTNTFETFFASESAVTSNAGSFQISFNDTNSGGFSTTVADIFRYTPGSLVIESESATNPSYTKINANNILNVSRTSANATAAYINGGNLVSGSCGGSAGIYFTEFKLGQNRGTGVHMAMDVAEFMIFKNKLNDAQRIILNNHLATKYNISLDANTVYEGGASGYDYEVAGIGQAANGSQNLTAQGEGLVKISNASNLGNDEFLMWGHDNSDITIGLPVSFIPSGGGTAPVNILDRKWYFSENNSSGTAIDVGTTTVTIDLSGMAADPTITASDLIMVVDDDGTWGTGTTCYTATLLASNIATFTGVDITDASIVTFGSSSSARPIAIVEGTGLGGYYGPVGVGNNDGSDLYLWVRSDLTSSITQSSGVSSWGDQSGNANHLTQNSTSRRPSYSTLSNAYNGLNVVTFDGTTSSTGDRLEKTLTQFTDEDYSFMMVWDDARGGAYTTGEGVFASASTTIADSFDLSFTTSATEFKLTNGSTVATSTNWSPIQAKHIFGYTRTSADAYTHWINNTGATSKTLTGTQMAVWDAFRFGAARGSGTNSYSNANIAECIIYKKAINNLEKSLITNYLSAKYDVALGASEDIYKGDNDGYDFDVFGIGNDATDTHLDAQGTGIVRFNNPTGLNSNEYFIVGANINNVLINGSSPHTFSRVTSGNVDNSRLNTVWYVTESDGASSPSPVDVGDVNVRFDLSKIDFGALDTTNGCLELKMVIDQDGDAVFDQVDQTVNLTIANGYATATIPGTTLTDDDLFTLQYQDGIVYKGSWIHTAGGNVEPDANDDCYNLVFKNNYTFTGTPVIDVLTLTVEDGVTVTFPAGSKITVSDQIELNNTGKLKLLGDAQLIQTHLGSNINTINLPTGAAFFNTITPPAKSSYVFSYFSSPVDEDNGTYKVGTVLKDGRINPLSLSTEGDNITFFTNDSDGYQNGSETGISANWIYSYVNGTTSNEWISKLDTGSINSGLGFSMKYPGTASQPFVFKGRPNSGGYSQSITSAKYTLVGNPYPCALDANDFIDENASAITGSLYFLQHQTTASSHLQNQYELGYGVYTKSTATAASTSITGTAGLGNGTYTAPDRYIPVGQGFMIEGDTNGGTLVFSNSQRAFKTLGEDGVGVDGSIFYKVKNRKQSKIKQETVKNIHFGMEFQLTPTTYYHRNLAVSFNEANTLRGKDYGYEATLFDEQPSDAYIDINTVGYDESEQLVTKDEKFVISGVEDIHEDLEIPVTVVLDENREVFFTLDDKQNIANDVYLIDKQDATIYNLSESKVSKNLTAGIYKDRFSITFENKGIMKSPTEEDLKIRIKKSDKEIEVLNYNQKIVKLTLVDIVGREVGFSFNTKFINTQNISKGIYLLRIQGETDVKSIKVLL